MATQRVWLVGQRGAADVVRRTYLVSGSVTDNLRPGHLRGLLASRCTRVGVDDSGTMQYMVRFTHGRQRRDRLPRHPGARRRLVQTRAELGTPQSHGCIRQWRPDAQALWSFAPVGTQVVVVA